MLQSRRSCGDFIVKSAGKLKSIKRTIWKTGEELCSVMVFQQLSWRLLALHNRKSVSSFCYDPLVNDVIRIM